MEYNLQPGDILLFKTKKGFDPIGSFITSQERDTDVCHAAFVGVNGNIWTTGADKFIFYGQVNAAKYLKDRSFYVCRLDSPALIQLSIMDTNAERMKGMIYGFWKVQMLIMKSDLGGIVRRLHPWLTKVVKNPFCSEAVADCCWKAGFRVCFCMGKEEPSAITPANLKTYAQLKLSPLDIVCEVNQ